MRCLTDNSGSWRVENEEEDDSRELFNQKFSHRVKYLIYYFIIIITPCQAVPVHFSLHGHSFHTCSRSSTRTMCPCWIQRQRINFVPRHATNVPVATALEVGDSPEDWGSAADIVVKRVDEKTGIWAPDWQMVPRHSLSTSRGNWLIKSSTSAPDEDKLMFNCSWGRE